MLNIWVSNSVTVHNMVSSRLLSVSRGVRVGVRVRVSNGVSVSKMIRCNSGSQNLLNGRAEMRPSIANTK